MKIVTFVSHYFQFKVNIRLTDGNYHKLMHNILFTPIQLFIFDADLVSYGSEPLIFSVGQIKKLNKALSGSEYWDKII